jgi:hypothetical protein
MCLSFFFQRMVIQILLNKKIQMFYVEMSLTILKIPFPKP